MADGSHGHVKPAPLTSQRHRITIVASVLPGRAELLAALESAAWANARWFLAMHDAGREPPCCVSCSGLLYDEDRPAVDVLFATGDALLERGHGSCGELAAFDAGRLRANELKLGRTPELAALRARVDLVPRVTDDPQAELWHAVVRSGTSISDVTVDIPRTRSAPRAPCGCGG